MTTDPKQFQRLLELIPTDIMKDVWFFPLPSGKKFPPDVPKGTVMNFNEEYRLSPSQALDRMKAGKNVLIYARPQGLLFIDADTKKGKIVLPEETLTNFPATLKIKSRNGGYHYYFLNTGVFKNKVHKYDGVKSGEIKADWQYVVAPGSYVANDDDGTEDANGLYSIINDAPIMTLEKLPEGIIVSADIPKDDIQIEIQHKGTWINDLSMPLFEIRRKDKVLDTFLKGANEADRSAADYATVQKLYFWRFTDSEIAGILQEYRPYEKTERHDYLETTISKIGGKRYDPNYKSNGNGNSKEATEEPLKKVCGECDYKPRKGGVNCRHPERRDAKGNPNHYTAAIDPACDKYTVTIVTTQPQNNSRQGLRPIPHEEIDPAPITIQELIDEFKNGLYIEEDIIISIPLSFAISNHSLSDPDALGIIGASGSAKTEMVRVLGETENQFILPISSMTSKTFVSGYKDAQDLAPQLRGRLITTKDFTSILSKNKDEVSGIFADLREILDGYIQKNFGGDIGKKEFKDIHSSWLFACTSAIEKYYSVYSALGQRLVFFRPETDARKARLKAMANTGKEKEMRKNHHALTMRLMNTVLKENKERIDHLTANVPLDMQERIGRLCEFLAVVRTHIERDFKGDMASIPEPELPTRLTKTLCKMVDAHSILYSRTPTINDEMVAVRLILDNIPTERRTVLEALCAFDEAKPTSEIAITAQIPTSMCNRVLNDLHALGIVTRIDRTLSSSNSDKWQIIEESNNDEKQFKTAFLLISNFNLWPIVSDNLKGEILCGGYEKESDPSLPITVVIMDLYKNNKDIKYINEQKTRQIVQCVLRYIDNQYKESHPSTFQVTEPEKKKEEIVKKDVEETEPEQPITGLSKFIPLSQQELGKIAMAHIAKWNPPELETLFYARKTLVAYLRPIDDHKHDNSYYDKICEDVFIARGWMIA